MQKNTVTIELTKEDHGLLCRALLDASTYVVGEKQKTYLDRQAAARADSLLERYDALKKQVGCP